MIPRSKSKYGNKKTKIGQLTFDSKKEARRYLVLQDLEKRGLIHDLRTQVRFKFPINGELLRYVDSNRAITYVADFTYFSGQDELTVEDVKGFKTRDYLIKKALMMSVHGVVVKETK